MAVHPDFTPVFAELRAILAQYSPRLDVKKDEPGTYYVDTFQVGPNNRPICFGMVRTGTRYVSFHLMPVYGDPELIRGMSPALRKRMQGKTCFNFSEIDRALFAELTQITKRAYQNWKKIEWVD